MDSSNGNIDNLLRDKFESFTPVPPQHIWSGIESGIDSKPAAFFLNRKQITIAAIIALLTLVGSFFIINPLSDNSSENKITNSKTIINTIAAPVKEKIEIHNSSANNTSIAETTEDIIIEEEINIANNKSTNTIVAEEIISESKVEEDEKFNSEIYITQEHKSNFVDSEFNAIASNMETINSRNNYSLVNNSDSGYIPENRSINSIPSNYENEIEIPSDPRKSMWKIGYYISPELTVSNIDSVEILNSYSINVEPTYYFNDHWFIRSGFGLTFARDRGYARIKYSVNEYMGSYDDVYDITFDTVSGDVIPTYHTKSVEVWDTVRHVSVSSITNSYLYLQVPLLFGYSSKSSGSPFSWYFLGGPAFYFKTTSWIEDPKPDNEDADIFEMKNNLPVRSDSYFQLWLGAGLEYEINNKLSVAAEPSYRHYLNNIYTNTNNNGPSSGFVFRVGLVYKLK